jgi:hypothetical protein
MAKYVGLYFLIKSFNCLLALLLLAPLIFQERIEVSRRASINNNEDKGTQERNKLSNHVLLIVFGGSMMSFCCSRNLIDGFNVVMAKHCFIF